MVRYTTRSEKEELLYSTIRSVDNCFHRTTPNRDIFHVHQAFKDNIQQARVPEATTQRRLEFARLAMQTWTPSSPITGVGIGNVVETQRRLVLDDRVRVLDSILRNWGVDTPWMMQDGNLSFPFHVDRDTASQNPTPRVNNPGTTSVPINGASQLNHMLLQLKQLSS